MLQNGNAFVQQRELTRLVSTEYNRYHRVSGECFMGCTNLVSTVCVWAGTRVQCPTIDYFDCGWKELGGGWLDLS